MRFNKIALVVGMGAVMMSAFASAADQGHGSVTFTGSIIDAPCSITPGSIDQTVNLGQVSNKALENGGKSSPSLFQIKLENCDVSALQDKTVTVTFTGTESTAMPGFLALSGNASGASLAITNNNGANIPLGTASSATSIQQDNTLLFSAYLQGDGASTAVVPGSFMSVANFTLAYQ